MNNQAVVKFLAEQVMGWVYDEKLDGWLGVDEFAPVYFDPMNDIKHMFMVEDAMDNATRERYAGILIEHEAIAYTNHFDETEFDYANVFDVIHASPKQRCIAAAKALADDEQRKEWGL